MRPSSNILNSVITSVQHHITTRMTEKTPAIGKKYFSSEKPDREIAYKGVISPKHMTESRQVPISSLYGQCNRIY